MACKITVGKPHGEVLNGEFVLSARISGAVNGKCFYSLPEMYRDWVDPERSDCFLVGLLYTAMYAGADLEIDGAVSEMLLFRVNTYAIPVLNGLEPKLRKIHVTAATSVEIYSDADVNGAGFSGGIDSFYTIWNRSSTETPERFRINTLFFFNVGSHGMGVTPDRLTFLEEKFHARLNMLKSFAEEVQMPLVPVNSNLHSFHQTGHLQTSSLASISAALFMQKKIRNYYLGSPGSDYYTLIRTQETNNGEIELVNDYLLPNLCTESFTAIADGSDAARTKKTAEILAYEPVYRYLNVCGDQETIEKNCSVCTKCRRTMITLDLLGVLDKFSGVFDLTKYDRKARRRFAAEVLNCRNHDLFFEDIYKLSRQLRHDLRKDTDWGTRLYMAFTRTRLFGILRDWKRHRNNL